MDEDERETSRRTRNSADHRMNTQSSLLIQGQREAACIANFLGRCLWESEAGIGFSLENEPYQKCHLLFTIVPNCSFQHRGPFKNRGSEYF